MAVVSAWTLCSRSTTDGEHGSHASSFGSAEAVLPALGSWLEKFDNMNHETAASKSKEIADGVLAPNAGMHDKAGSFSGGAIDSIARAGLFGVMLPAVVGGSGLGPGTLSAIIATFAEADASVAMVFLMHLCASTTIASARPAASVEDTLKEISAGRHLTTLAFSEAGSRSHFWAPVSRARANGAGVRITAKKSWVTSAGHANSYVVCSLAPEGEGLTGSCLYLIPAGAAGLTVAGPWDGFGMRANASAPMSLDDCQVPYESQLTEDGAGFQIELQSPRQPRTSRTLASIIWDRASARVCQHCGPSWRRCRSNLERPRDATMLRVLETKAAAGDTAIAVTSTAMRVCGGAAFSKHMNVERLFRDAHAGAVMAPTGDVLRELIGRALLGMPLF